MIEVSVFVLDQPDFKVVVLKGQVRGGLSKGTHVRGSC